MEHFSNNDSGGGYNEYMADQMGPPGGMPAARPRVIPDAEGEVDPNM